MSDEGAVTLYGSGHCHKTGFYRSKLDSYGITYRFLDVTLDPQAADDVRARYDGKLHFPVFKIGSTWLRNPIEKKLLQILDREGIYRRTDDMTAPNEI